MLELKNAAKGFVPGQNVDPVLIQSNIKQFLIILKSGRRKHKLF